MKTTFLTPAVTVDELPVSIGALNTCAVRPPVGKAVILTSRLRAVVAGRFNACRGSCCRRRRALGRVGAGD